jgi:thioredoxin-like negative regulator of GroEL
MATPERPTLVVFRSALSGPCRKLDGQLSMVLQRGGNHETFSLVDVDVGERPDLAQRFCIADVPTLFVVVDHKVVARATRPRSIGELRALLQPWLHVPSKRPDASLAA